MALGQSDRFLALVHRYLTKVRVECGVVAASLKPFEARLADVRAPIEAFAQALKRTCSAGVPPASCGVGVPPASDSAGETPTPQTKSAVIEAAAELDEAASAYLREVADAILMRRLEAAFIIAASSSPHRVAQANPKRKF